jgi:hypothetical protein
LAHYVEHLMFVPLIKEVQLGNGHATGSNPAGDEHGTKAGFRDRTRAATADGLAVHKTGENSVVELTMGSSVFKQGRASVQHLQDSDTKAEHTVQRKRGDVAVLQGRNFNSATGQAVGLLLGVLRSHAGAPCPAARKNGRRSWRRERDAGGEGATDTSSRHGAAWHVDGGATSSARR